MPVEIKEIVVKAVVENKIGIPSSNKQEMIDAHQLNIELMMQEMLKTMKNKNER